MSLKAVIAARIESRAGSRWVFCACDFKDLGSPRVIRSALASLAKSGSITRLSRGFYYVPQPNPLLRAEVIPAPPHDQVIAALSRRYGLALVPDSLYFANGLGLTNAVLARVAYYYSGRSRMVKIGSMMISLNHASHSFMRHATASYGPAFQALTWLGKDVALANRDFINAKLPAALLNDLRRADGLPAWMRDVIKQS